MKKPVSTIIIIIIITSKKWVRPYTLRHFAARLYRYSHNANDFASMQTFQYDKSIKQVSFSYTG